MGEGVSGDFVGDNDGELSGLGVGRITLSHPPGAAWQHVPGHDT